MAKETSELPCSAVPNSCLLNSKSIKEQHRKHINATSTVACDLKTDIWGLGCIHYKFLLIVFHLIVNHKSTLNLKTFIMAHEYV